ncbi:nitroreductase family protein [Mycoplasma sp. CSL7503-lung]|uniref:nitroreductase family protein n=1 Tax=Mycoplasma sp. CSL7503-lung TaxID=536372 RepID=UPI0021D197EA|nr:nitroreductase family protein [Mycoplasma sp. CSL7503-lung]MCU4706532.1 nitroreductase family protein [Mycoplasma sp. CSL7503-lung]
MDFHEKILSRQSIREYDLNHPVSEEEKEYIIDVIKNTPTSSNWHSSSAIVITDKTILNKIAELYPKGTHIRTASIFVIFLADFNRMNMVLKSNPDVKFNKNSTETYTIAVGDAFIQATSAQDQAIDLGLGTCFVGFVRHIAKEIIELLNIKGQAFPVIGLTIGNKLNNNTLVKPKINRVFMNNYDIERISSDIEEYNPKLVDYIKESFPNIDPLNYVDSSINSAKRHSVQTELIEEIWDLELTK